MTKKTNNCKYYYKKYDYVYSLYEKSGFSFGFKENNSFSTFLVSDYLKETKELFKKLNEVDEEVKKDMHKNLKSLCNKTADIPDALASLSKVFTSFQELRENLSDTIKSVPLCNNNGEKEDLFCIKGQDMEILETLEQSLSCSIYYVCSVSEA